MDIKYITFNLSEIDKINFDELLTTSKDTLRTSNNNLAILKYDGEIPQSIQLLETKSEEYTHSQILELLLTEEWVVIYDEIIYKWRHITQ
jgi:hypothetical protein